MKKLRIGVRLALSYASLCALLVVVGAFGVAEIGALDTSVAEIAGDRWDRAHLAMQGLGLAGEQAAAVNALFLATDGAEIQRVLARIDQIRDRAGAVVKAREATLRSDRAKQLFARLDGLRSSYWAALQRGRDLLLAGRRDEALAIAKGEVVPGARGAAGPVAGHRRLRGRADGEGEGRGGGRPTRTRAPSSSR